MGQHEQEDDYELQCIEEAKSFLADPEIEAAISLLIEKEMSPDNIKYAAIIQDAYESGDYGD